MLHDRPLAGIAQIRPPDWCLTRLRTVSTGALCSRDERPRRRSVGVSCVAERGDLVFVVREQVEQTWFLVWSDVTIEVTGSFDDGQHWVVRVRGVCERETLPTWAAPAWDPEAHPPFGVSVASAPPFALRIRDAAVCGYSVLAEEQEAG